MGSGRVMLVLVFLVVVLGVEMPAKAMECSSILSCSTFLKAPDSKLLADSMCCSSARNLVHLGADAKTLCHCLSPFTAGFLPSKAKEIPSLCNLPAFSPLVTCLAPSRGVVPESFLPPAGPLPPVFQFPPNSFPLPPFIPLPPWVFSPPPPAATNAHKH